MQTFYSIIKLAPNSSAGDSISVGLLLCHKDKYFLLFSHNKINIVKKLIDDNADVIDFIVKQLSQHIEKLNTESVKSKSELFPLKTLLNSEYFSYLNTYCNGVLQFSAPAFINDEITEHKFLSLFKLFVENFIEKDLKAVVDPDKKFFNVINKKLIKKVSKKIHTNCTINHSMLDTLYFQYEMSCIGLNGAFVGAKALPFNKSNTTLDKDISHYIALISLLSSSYKKDVKNNHFFLIADEPSEIKSPEHKTWDNIQKNPLFKILHSEESEKVAEVVEKTKATKFFEHCNN